MLYVYDFHVIIWNSTIGFLSNSYACYYCNNFVYCHQAVINYCSTYSHSKFATGTGRLDVRLG